MENVNFAPLGRAANSIISDGQESNLHSLTPKVSALPLGFHLFTRLFKSVYYCLIDRQMLNITLLLTFTEHQAPLRGVKIFI